MGGTIRLFGAQQERERVQRPSEIRTQGIDAAVVEALADTRAGGVPTPLPDAERSDVHFAALMGVHPLANASREIAGSRIGRFIVTDRLGAGAMGVVLAAYDPKLDRKVAIKLVDPGLVGTEPGEAHARLEREAQAAAALSHPNVVTVYDVGRHEGAVFLAMEYVAGETLTDWLQRGDRSWLEVVRMFAAAGRGLMAAHEAGLVHRDFKPDNVIVGDDGRPRVADFGLARPVQGWSSRDADRAIASGRTVDAAITADDGAAEICGTPAYMAPEQYLGVDIGPHSDQFGFCAALFEGLYGMRPFPGESVSEIAHAVIQGRPVVPPRGGSAPPSVERVVLRGLASRPEDRHPSMAAVVDGLERAAGGPRRRRIALAASLASVSTLGVGYAFATMERPEPCAGVGDELDDVWNDPERERVAAALEAVGWGDRVEPLDRHLSDFADDWREDRVEACEQTRVHNEASEHALELRFACLDRTAAFFGAVTTELVEAASPERDPDRSLELMPRVGICDDLDELERMQDRLAERGDGVDIRALVTLETKLATAQAREALGRGDWPEAAAALANAAEQADAPRYRAHAARMQARLAQQAGNAEQAAELYAAAARWATEGHDPVLATDVMLQRAALALHRGDPELSAVHLEYAQSGLGSVNEFERARLQARMRIVEGAVAVRLGHNAQAQELLQAAVDEARNGPWRRDTERASELTMLLGELANAHKAMGDPERAADRLEEILEVYAETGRADDPVLAATHHNLAINATQLRQFERAATHYDEVDRLLELGPPQPAVQASLETNRGWLERERGRFAEARRLQESAAARCDATLGPNHPECAYPRLELAQLARLEGDDAEALAQIARVGEIRVATLGEDHPETAYALTVLAWILAEQGQTESARGPLQAAMAVYERHPDANPVDVATASYVKVRLEHAERGENTTPDLDALMDELDALGPRAESLRLEVAAWQRERARRPEVPDRPTVLTTP